MYWVGYFKPHLTGMANSEDKLLLRIFHRCLNVGELAHSDRTKSANESTTKLQQVKYFEGYKFSLPRYFKHVLETPSRPATTK